MIAPTSKQVAQMLVLTQCREPFLMWGGGLIGEGYRRISLSQQSRCVSPAFAAFEAMLKHQTMPGRVPVGISLEHIRVDWQKKSSSFLLKLGRNGWMGPSLEIKVDLGFHCS